MQEAIAGDASLKKRFQDSYRQWQGLISARLREHFPKTASTCSPRLLASLLLAVIDGLSIQASLDYAPVKYHEIAQALAALFTADGGDILHKPHARRG